MQQSFLRKLLKEESELRQKVIDRTFSIIHNGPLQTLSGIRRYAQTQGDSNLTSYFKEPETLAQITLTTSI